jgi:hypothetical protein
MNPDDLPAGVPRGGMVAIQQLKEIVRGDGHSASEENHQQLLSGYQIGKRYENGNRQFMSVVKEIDPHIKEPTLRASWRYAVYDIEESIHYTDPELEPEIVAFGRLTRWLSEALPNDETVAAIFNDTK